MLTIFKNLKAIGELDLHRMSFKPNHTPNTNLIKNIKCAYGEGNSYQQVHSLRFYYYVVFLPD